MVFVSGVHGVGKSYFCGILKERLNISSHTASFLISERKKARFSTDKHVADIDVNQLYLLEAVKELKDRNEEFLLDGHFCLLDQTGKITRVPLETFIRLSPDAIVLLIETPAIIAKRRKERDGVEHSIVDIKAFQDEELKYAQEVAELLHIPLKVSSGSSDIESTIEFIRDGRS